jgi:hypothetical protein
VITFGGPERCPPQGSRFSETTKSERFRLKARLSAASFGLSPTCKPQSTASSKPLPRRAQSNHSKPFTWTADPDKIIAAVRRGHQVLDSIKARDFAAHLQAKRSTALHFGSPHSRSLRGCTELRIRENRRGSGRGSDKRHAPSQLRIEPHHPILPDRDVGAAQRPIRFHRTTANARTVP